MEYNEEEFAKSANRKVMTIWLCLCVILSVAYVIEVFKGQRTVPYHILPYFCCFAGARLSPALPR